MNHYTELKEKFNHLQKRTLELFELGTKRENELKEALANIWNEVSKISELKNAEEIKLRLLAVKDYTEKSFLK